MVRNDTLKRLLVLLLLAMLIFSAACGRAGQSAAPAASAEKGRGEPSHSSGAEESAPERESMRGPDVPPDGMPYDEWKGIRYSSETSMPVTTFFELVMRDGSLPEDRGYDTGENLVFGSVEIVDVKAAPVGGEMKLRSGGYVDVTIKIEWTGTLSFSHDDAKPHSLTSVVFQSEDLTPFDYRTGAALFNYSEGEEGTATGVGEATDSGYIESVVTWNGRAYRLFAKQDHRNRGGRGGWESETNEGVTVTTCSEGTETIYSFRLPADYDGLALCIQKDISQYREFNLSDRGEILSYRDLYADVLTDNQGKRHDPGEFYFVKVSDLVELYA